MSLFIDAAKIFGIGRAPWVIRVYIVLLPVCVVLVMFAVIESANEATKQVLGLALDSFKIFLGTVIGALSIAASHEWGAEAGEPREKNKFPPDQPARQKSFTIWEHRGCVERTETVAVSIIASAQTVVTQDR